MLPQSTNSLQKSEMVAAGSNELGQFGFGPKSSKCKKYEKPKFFSYNIRITSISCGFNHSSFVVDDHLVYTVGSNEYGKLGISDATSEFSCSPCLLETLANKIIKKVACGFSHTVALTNDGDIYVWGNGSEGQLGVGETPLSINSPFQLNLEEIKSNYNFTTFKEVSCGEKHTMVLSENGLCFAWGSSESGQLGTGKNERELSPCFLTFFAKKSIKTIACGYSHTLFLTKSKNVYETGYNSHKELGLGNNLASFLPVKISKIQHESVVSIFAGSHSAAITEKGDLYVWGSETFGDIGEPIKFNGSNNKFIDASIGLDFGVGLDMEGMLHFWGENQSGQLGFGDFAPRSTLTENKNFEGKKVKKITCGGEFFIGILEEDQKNVRKRNIIDNIMNGMTTSKKKVEENISVSNRKVLINNTELKNRKTQSKETLKENLAIKETIKIKTLFNPEENNGMGGVKSLDSSKQKKMHVKEELRGKSLSTSFDQSQKQQQKAKPSLENSVDVIHFQSLNEAEGEENNVLLKNRQNGLEFKIKIKEYEDCIKLLELREKSIKQKVKEQERSHNERYHQLSQFYNELKEQYETLTSEFSQTTEKLENEINEKKKLEDKLKVFLKEKKELHKIFSQQSIDIEALHESLMIMANDIESKDRDLIKLYNLKEKDKSMIKLLRSQLEESIMKLDVLEHKKQNNTSNETENLKEILEKKNQEILSLKKELENQKSESKIAQKDRIIQLENIIQQKDIENDQMKTIIYELNTQNKFFREELGHKSQLHSPEFQEIKETTEFNQSETNNSQLDSKRMELNELAITNRSEDMNINLLNSPEINPITPTEQNRVIIEKFETPLNVNNSINSFGEKQMELKDMSNMKINEKMDLETNQKKMFKKTPMRKIEREKENLSVASKTSERNDSMLESISSSVYEKIVMSNKSLNNIKSRLTDLQKNRNVLEERMKDFESKLSV